MTLESKAAALILLAASIAGSAFAQARGADVYKAKCASCHGADGLATTPAAKKMKAVSLKAPEVMKWSDAQLTAFTRDAYKNYGMTDEQIKDVVAYIRKLQK